MALIPTTRLPTAVDTTGTNGVFFDGHAVGPVCLGYFSV